MTSWEMGRKRRRTNHSGLHCDSQKPSGGDNNTKYILSCFTQDCKISIHRAERLIKCVSYKRPNDPEGLL